jgi:hypothetical protein
MNRTTAAEQLNNFWWVRLPAVVGRWSRALAGILVDGLYLSAVPLLSACMPLLLLLLGLLIGWLHPGFADQEVFTASLLVLAIMIGIGASSAAWGGWLWLGYVLGDLLLYRHAGYQYFRGQFFEQLFRARLPLFIPYILLALALMFIPLISRLLRTQTLGWLKRSGAITTGLQAVLQGLLQGALVFMWTQAVPTLIRPVYTWSGSNPTVEVMQPLQAWGWALAIFAALPAVARVVFERRNMGQPGVAQRAAALQTALRANVLKQRPPLPVWASVVLKTIFTTFLLAGVLETWVDALLFAIVLALMLLGRAYLTTRVGFWVRLVARIPLLIRLVVGVLVNFFLTTWIVTAMWNNSSGTFRPIIISVALSLLVFFLLMPDLSVQAPRSGTRTQAAHETEQPA